MSGSLTSVVVTGFSTMVQFLGGIQQSLVAISSTLKSFAIGLAANNIFTGNNTFDGTSTFNGNSTFNAPAAFTSTATFTDGAAISPAPTIEVGGATTTFLEPAGLISVQVSVAGVGNGANTSNDILFSYSLPANALSAVGKSVLIEAAGNFAANGNNKVVQLVWGSSTPLSTGTLTNNNGWWTIRLFVTKYGANQQWVDGFFTANGNETDAYTGSAAETDTGAILILVTGASPTTGAASDVVGHTMRVTAFN